MGSREEEEEEQGQSRRQGSGGHGGCWPPGTALGSAAADVGMKGGGQLGAKRGCVNKSRSPKSGLSRVRWDFQFPSLFLP